MSDTSFWFLLTFLCIATHGFFSMLEMASVSFSRVRMHYYITKGSKSAIWLNWLMERPARLFGTTLVCVNVALQIGSECSRQLYIALELNPDLSPLTQVLVVVVFAELAPMFAARRYAEHVVMLGIPIIYASSKLLTPLIWMITHISKLANRIVGITTSEDPNFFINREELQQVLRGIGEQDSVPKESEEFTVVVSNIFAFKKKSAVEVMEPLNRVQMVPSNCTANHMRNTLLETRYPALPIYHKTRKNVIGIIYPREVINLPDSRRIRDFARPPWFLAEKTPLLDILHQFRQNNRTIGVVLDGVGSAIGVITLQDVLDEIFGERKLTGYDPQDQPQVMIERTFLGKTRIKDFNEQFSASIHLPGAKTLAQLMHKSLGHHPEKGESIRIDRFEFTVEESGIAGIKTLSVRSLV